MDVVVSGQQYAPVLRAGVAVTTFNRPDVLAETLSFYLKHTPEWMPIVVVDDASTVPAVVPDRVQLIRNPVNRGIAAAKNQCIAALMDLGVEHLFLSDDDCHPTTDEWWELYADHPEPHLMMLFKNPDNPNLPPTVYDDGTLYALEHPRGCLLYVHKSAVERVGGMRPEFGKWGWEHVEFSKRIHAAGLTTFPFQDVHGTKLYSMDEHLWNSGTFQRSVPLEQRNQAVCDRLERRVKELDGSTDFVEYRDLPNLAITTLLTKHADPQRTEAKLSLADTEAWADSLIGCDSVILTDKLEGENTVLVPTGLRNPYLQRWVSVYQYLRDTPAKWVWVTDGTDVTMLREPWDHMEPGTLYIGYEPQVVGIVWMRHHHPAHKDWIESNKHRTLLNGGVVGGDHATVLNFAKKVVNEIITSKTRDLGDMAVINKVAYSLPHMTGPQVVTLFKHDDNNDFSWFRHK